MYRLSNLWRLMLDKGRNEHYGVMTNIEGSEGGWLCRRRDIECLKRDRGLSIVRWMARRPAGGKQSQRGMRVSAAIDLREMFKRAGCGWRWYGWM